MKRRLSLLLLSVIMIFTMMPMMAFADAPYEEGMSWINLQGPYYGLPGETLSRSASLGSMDENAVASEFKWTKISGSATLTVNAKDNGKTATFKLPSTTGTTKFKVAAYDKDGVKICEETYAVSCKKKPTLSFSVREDNPAGKLVKTKLVSGKTYFFDMKNADFAWDNNKTHKFYKWIIKDPAGKTTTIKTGMAGKAYTKFTDKDGAAGGMNPNRWLLFKGIGKYTITAKIYHSDKLLSSVTKTYTVVPKGTSLTKVTAASKGFTAKWSKQATRTSGYQIQYSRNSNFSGSKTVTVKGATKISKKVTGLKGGKKYYVRVRTYKTVNGTKYFSAWSAKKTVTTKK